jgi:hypothetical protein
MCRIVVAAAEQGYGAILIAVGEPIGVGKIRHGVSKVDFRVQKAYRVAVIAHFTRRRVFDLHEAMAPQYGGDGGKKVGGASSAGPSVQGCRQQI